MSEKGTVHVCIMGPNFLDKIAVTGTTMQYTDHERNPWGMILWSGELLCRVLSAAAGCHAKIVYYSQ